MEYWGESGSRSTEGDSALLAPATVHRTPRQAVTQSGCSSRRLLGLASLSLLSQHHTTALPSLKRYDKRYDVRLLSEVEPIHRRFTYEVPKRCMLVSTKLVPDFSAACAG